MGLILPIKTVMYFLLMTRQRMRVRSATLASLALTNFSEFGLIVGAIGVAHGWLGSEWLSVIALSLAISFLIASPLNSMSRNLYARWRHALHRFQTRARLPGDEIVRAGKAQVVVFGMGRVGTGAYDYLRRHWGDVVLGIDINEDYVARHRAAGRVVAHGDATDADFWARAERSGHVKLALLAFSDHGSIWRLPACCASRVSSSSWRRSRTIPITNSRCAMRACTRFSTSTPAPARVLPNTLPRPSPA